MKETQPEKSLFREWQLPRVATFIPHIMVFPSFWLVFAPLNADLGLILGIVATVFSVWIRFALSKRIVVTESELALGNARIPRSVLGQATVVEKEEQFAERGPKLDARAYVALKALDGLVKIENTDAADPTPYILISTRRPEQLRQALSAKKR
jgi:hypothetical protein